MAGTAYTIQSILNGALGNSLAASHNKLAIDMDFYSDGMPINLDIPLASQLSQTFTNKLIVFVHGLTNTEAVWDFVPTRGQTKSDNYGTRLQETFQYTTFYLRYNTGLNIQQNGQAFLQKMTRLLKQYPIEVDEIVLFGFSMGGLVVRYAQADQSSKWSLKITQCFYIGTPHKGAPLAKFGHLASNVLHKFPQDYVNIWGDWVNLRSEGIKNLRCGLGQQNQNFRDDVRHHFISGGIFKSHNRFKARLIGDGLVLKGSAHPSDAPSDSLYAHFDGIHHMSLAHCDEVYQQISVWFKGFASERHTVFYKQSDRQVVNRFQPVSSHGELLTGYVQLVSDFYGKVLHTTDVMHHEISNETYKRLSTIPLISKASNAVRAVHFKTSKALFSRLRFTKSRFL